MRRSLATVLFVFAAAVAPMTTYAADKQSKMSETKEKIKETAEDAAITAKIILKFADDLLVDANKLRVHTDHGAVRLRGKAKSQREINRAVEIAKNTEGVTSVTSEIRIIGHKRPSKEATKRAARDSAITSKVKAKLAADPTVSAANIRVSTHGGVVRLTGTARSAEEADTAAKLAKETKGVGSVDNGIRVEATDATR